MSKYAAIAGLAGLVVMFILTLTWPNPDSYLFQIPYLCAFLLTVWGLGDWLHARRMKTSGSRVSGSTASATRWYAAVGLSAASVVSVGMFLVGSSTVVDWVLVPLVGLVAFCIPTSLSWFKQSSPWHHTVEFAYSWALVVTGLFVTSNILTFMRWASEWSVTSLTLLFAPFFLRLVKPALASLSAVLDVHPYDVWISVDFPLAWLVPVTLGVIIGWYRTKKAA